jgi:hypothetical protein
MAARIVIKCIKIKNKKYHIVEIFNRKMVERDTPNKQIQEFWEKIIVQHFIILTYIFFSFLYCLILALNIYHLDPDFQVIELQY